MQVSRAGICGGYQTRNHLVSSTNDGGIGWKSAYADSQGLRPGAEAPPKRVPRTLLTEPRVLEHSVSATAKRKKKPACAGFIRRWRRRRDSNPRCTFLRTYSLSRGAP